MLDGTRDDGTIIVGNKIGTDITGTLALPNSIGVYIVNAARQHDRRQRAPAMPT